MDKLDERTLSKSFLMWNSPISEIYKKVNILCLELVFWTSDQDF